MGALSCDPSVAQLAPRLEEILGQQLDLLANLVEVMQQERSALVEFDVPLVEDLAHRKEGLCARQEVLEQARQQLTVQAGVADVSLTDIAAQVGGPAGSRLLELRSSLKALAATIADLNALNQGLLQHAKACVGGTVRVLQESLSDKPTYGRAGRMYKRPVGSGHALNRRL